ncbi:MAG: sulfatase/phosphatase domain-containing protein, partial [Phycisphaerae bacterium]
EVVSQLPNCRAVRTDRHKLIVNFNDTTELYDLTEDPDELTNLAADRPDLVAELGRRLRGRLLEGKWRR